MSRGRPIGGSLLNRTEIISVAFKLLAELGPEALSLRALARRLKVTPMALYRHFSSKEELVRGLSDALYARVVLNHDKVKTKPHDDQLKKILVLYYESVLEFPQLAVLIFSTPSEFSEQVKELNRRLANLLSHAGLSPSQRKLWLEVLVDMTHGSALAIAAHPKKDKAFLNRHRLRFQRQLDEVLSRIF